MDFTVVERDYLRRFLPDFDWTRLATPTRPVPLAKPIGEASVVLVPT